jgi:DNA-binding response OmpR family regulator
MSDSGPLILIIDDDIQIRRFLKTTLLNNGYQVIEAANRVYHAYSLESYPIQPPHSPELIARSLGFLFRGARTLLHPFIRGRTPRTPSL